MAFKMDELEKLEFFANLKSIFFQNFSISTRENFIIGALLMGSLMGPISNYKFFLQTLKIGIYPDFLLLWLLSSKVFAAEKKIQYVKY